MTRAELEAAWLELNRRVLPELAQARGWPVRHDHCFMRILLDAAHEGRWDRVVEGRPAYRHVAAERLAAAVRLGEAVAAGEADLWALNAASLGWRRRENGSGRSGRTRP